MDYFPDFIVVTYTKHESVRKLLSSIEINYKSSTELNWVFLVSKIDFIHPVRNCKSGKLSVSQKYEPFFLSKDKLEVIVEKMK